MTRVLLVCPEPLGHGQPAGIGIRFLEMANVLRDDGHAVTILSPSRQASGEARFHDLTPQNLLRFSEESDVAVVQGHIANDFFAHAKPIPTVVDLYDPFIIENLHYFPERGAEVFTHDHATLIDSLLRGDFFLCASEAQRLFYLGMLLAVGRVNPIAFETDSNFDALVRIAPFGVQPPRRKRGPSESADVLFGSIYDWYDPILAIDAVALARETIADLTLTFTRHTNPDITPQGKLADAIAYAESRHHDFVRFEPWVPYDRRGDFFERFAIALLTFPQSIETDLAMRTRVYDYLWGGLPIVMSSAPGTDSMLRRYGAGRIAGSVEELAAAIVDVLQNLEIFGSDEFVRDHQWSQTLAPLREFVRAPRVDPHKDSFAARQNVPAQPPSILARIRRRMKALT